MPRASIDRLAATAVVVMLGCAPRATSVGSPRADLGAAEVMDPQQVRDQDDMTWEDYRPIPGVDWAQPARTGTKRTMRVAIVPADYEDFPFVLTLKKASDL